MTQFRSLLVALLLLVATSASAGPSAGPPAIQYTQYNTGATVETYVTNVLSPLGGTCNGSVCTITLPSNSILPEDLDASSGGSPGASTYYRGDGGWGNPSGITKVRTSDSTAKNSNVTLAIDQGTGPDLTGWAVTNGLTYRIEADLAVTTGTTADFKLAFAGPAGSTCRIAVTAIGTASGADTPAFLTVCTNTPTGVKVGDLGSSADNTIRVSGYFTAGATGTLDVQWTQNISQSTNTTLDAGSAMSVTLTQ